MTAPEHPAVREILRAVPEFRERFAAVAHDGSTECGSSRAVGALGEWVLGELSGPEPDIVARRVFEVVEQLAVDDRFSKGDALADGFVAAVAHLPEAVASMGPVTQSHVDVTSSARRFDPGPDLARALERASVNYPVLHAISVQHGGDEDPATDLVLRLRGAARSTLTVECGGAVGVRFEAVRGAPMNLSSLVVEDLRANQLETVNFRVYDVEEEWIAFWARTLTVRVDLDAPRTRPTGSHSGIWA